VRFWAWNSAKTCYNPVEIMAKTTRTSTSTPQEEMLVSYFKKALYLEPLGSFLSGLVTTGLILMAVILVVKGSLDWQKARSTPATPVAVQPVIQVHDIQELPAQAEFVQDPADHQWYPKQVPGKYIVKSGDSSWNIALAIYGDGELYREIEKENNLTPNQALVVGQEVKLPRIAVPAPAGAELTPAPTLSFPTATPLPSPVPIPTTQTQGGRTHTVLSGQGLWQIAEAYYNDGNQFMKIYEANRDKMQNPEDIEEGMVLNIP
jgi:nucleoid-associated protein YgaU